jgi:hypothetical protein
MDLAAKGLKRSEQVGLAMDLGYVSGELYYSHGIPSRIKTTSNNAYSLFPVI